jgi:hypothetical protein
MLTHTIGKINTLIIVISALHVLPVDGGVKMTGNKPEARGRRVGKDKKE